MNKIEARFWSKVDKTDSCWLWTKAKSGTGYGRAWIDGRYVSAHRTSYEWAVGPIPEGLELDHTCHVHNCVRPEHLRLATRKQNNENLAGPHRDSKSGVRGVCWHKGNKKWHATVGHNGQSISLGYFNDIKEAEATVIVKRAELFTHSSDVLGMAL